MATQVFTFTVTGTNAVLLDELDAFVYQNNYQDTVINPADGTPMANPESKIAFTKRMLIEFFKNSVKARKAQLAADAAALAAHDAAEAALNIS